MGRYERMICYLYEYQDGHKGANVGYVKLEKRGEKCRVLIQMRRADLATLPQAALFQQEKTGVLLIPIGVMRDNNGSMKGQYEGNVDNLAGTGLSLDDVHGVLVYVEEDIILHQHGIWNRSMHGNYVGGRGINMRMQEKQRLYLRAATRHRKTWLFHQMVATGHRKTWMFHRIVAARHCKTRLFQRIVAARHRKTWMFQRIVAARHRKKKLLHLREASIHREKKLFRLAAAAI